MTNIHIPPEAVEAAARGICETENGPCECLPDECGCTYWTAHATAAIRAALENWPGAKRVKGYFTHDADYYEPAFILPLTTENPDAEA